MIKFHKFGGAIPPWTFPGSATLASTYLKQQGEQECLSSKTFRPVIISGPHLMGGVGTPLCFLVLRSQLTTRFFDLLNNTL